MSFNDNVQLDPSQVQDRRGMGRGGKVGIGLGGGIILLIASLLGINPSLLEGLGGTQDPGSQSQGTAPACETGADADARLDCRITGTVNSLNAFWPAYLAQYNRQYPQPGTVIFEGGTNTGCGAATSEVGPFYCPADSTAYFDPGFFQELVDRFGSSGGPLAQEYVVAHEFGHHIQNVLGNLDRAQQDPQGPESGAVRVELQADCYAGLWVRYATTQEDPNTGLPFLEPLTERDLQDALSAASAVGDDRIQKAATGRVSPEAWTHGSSAQRQKWFYQGYSTGDINQCDTFAVVVSQRGWGFQMLKPRARIWSRPSSVIRSGPHGGIHTQLRRHSSTTPSRALPTCSSITSVSGQAAVVSVMSMSRAPSSSEYFRP